MGSNHLREIDALISRVWPDAARWTRLRGDAFLLDNGLVRLSEWFSEVTLHRYPDGLLVTEAGPLVAYILSMIPVRARSERHVTRLRAAEFDPDRQPPIRSVGERLSLVPATPTLR